MTTAGRVNPDHSPTPANPAPAASASPARSAASHPPDAASAGTPPPSRWRRATAGRSLSFPRTAEDRVLAGVAGGLARRLGIDPVLLRLSFVVLATAGGAGVALYLLAWALSTPSVADADPPAPRRRTPQVLGMALITLGLLVLLRDAGLWFGDAVTWPLALVAAGSAALLRGRGDRIAPTSAVGRLLRGDAAPGGTGAALRAIAGAGLVLGGLAVFVAVGPAGVAALGPVLLAMAVTAAGLGLLLGPRLWDLSRSVAEERRERIRSAERAEMAAHLHDSVLQTLALIQRADDPRKAAQLARAQERDLRAWLYGTGSTPGTLRAAVDDLAARIEARHGVRVEPVVVGDAGVDERLAALIAALGEATENAARHAGVEEVSVFVEVSGEGVDASVLDEGCGFDPARVPGDRVGLRESIRGRLRRVGGTAEVGSEPGEGTEIRLRLPRG